MRVERLRSKTCAAEAWQGPPGPGAHPPTQVHFAHADTQHVTETRGGDSDARRSPAWLRGGSAISRRPWRRGRRSCRDAPHGVRAAGATTVRLAGSGGIVDVAGRRRWCCRAAQRGGWCSWRRAGLGLLLRACAAGRVCRGVRTLPHRAALTQAGRLGAASARGHPACHRSTDRRPRRKVGEPAPAKERARRSYHAHLERSA